MDNDDFKTDTLTRSSEINHRTNVMFVQNESLIDKRLPPDEAPTFNKSIATSMMNLVIKYTGNTNINLHIPVKRGVNQLPMTRSS